MQVQSLEYRRPAIFGWLELFDTNILLVLAIVPLWLWPLCIALLVLIVDRIRMIGTLKALGASDRLFASIYVAKHAYAAQVGLGQPHWTGSRFVQWQFGLSNWTKYLLCSMAPISFDFAWIVSANAAFHNFFILDSLCGGFQN